MMPLLGGLEVRRRPNGAGHRSPIVFISANPELAAGLGVPVVTKPFDSRNLLRTVDAVLAAGT